MNSLSVFAALLLLTFVGSISLFKLDRKRSPLAYFFFSGTGFLLLGVLISPGGLGLLSVDVLAQLRPLIHFGLGWIGFLYGFQLEWRYLKRIPSGWFLSAGALYFLPALVLTAFGWMLITALTHFLYLPVPLAVSGVAVLAILLSESCTAFVFWAMRRYRYAGRQYRMCCFVSAIDNFFPILFVTFLPVLISVDTGNLNALVSIGLQLSFGVVSGYAVHYMVRRVEDSLEVSTILFGLVFALSGAAYLLRFSMLFVTMTAGITFTNLTRRHAWFQKRLTPVEKPLYLLFMIVLPVYALPFGWAPLIVAALLVPVKYWTKRLGIVLTRHWHHAPSRFKKRAAFLLLPMSGIGPAMLLEIQERFQTEWMAWVTTVFVFALLIAELAGTVGLFRTAAEKTK